MNLIKPRNRIALGAGILVFLTELSFRALSKCTPCLHTEMETCRMTEPGVNFCDPSMELVFWGRFPFYILVFLTVLFWTRRKEQAAKTHSPHAQLTEPQFKRLLLFMSSATLFFILGVLTNLRSQENTEALFFGIFSALSIWGLLRGIKRYRHWKKHGELP